jgi:hypothetical protein
VWSSVSGKSYTLVVFVTLFYAFWNHGEPKLVQQTRTTQTVPCESQVLTCPPIWAQITTIAAAPVISLSSSRPSVSHGLTLLISTSKRQRELLAS